MTDPGSSTAAAHSIPNDLGATLAEMILAIHEETTVHATVEQTLDFARSAVSCGGAAVVFVHAKQRIETVASTDPMWARLHATQMELREGPDLSVLQSHHSVVVDDTREETRWPRWAAAAAETGLLSMISVRLYTSERTIGSLNLYDGQARHFSQTELEVAHVLARHAAIALSHIQEAEHLWRAIDARKRIGQAQGILMERHDLDEDRAFDVLRRYSQDNNVKLHDIARMVVEERRLPGSDPQV